MFTKYKGGQSCIPSKTESAAEMQVSTHPGKGPKNSSVFDSCTEVLPSKAVPASSGPYNSNVTASPIFRLHQRCMHTSFLWFSKVIVPPQLSISGQSSPRIMQKRWFCAREFERCVLTRKPTSAMIAQNTRHAAIANTNHFRTETVMQACTRAFLSTTRCPSFDPSSLFRSLV